MTDNILPVKSTPSGQSNLVVSVKYPCISPSHSFMVIKLDVIQLRTLLHTSNDTDCLL